MNMKNAVFAFVFLVTAASTAAQGTITFFSLNQIFRPGGTVGDGQGFVAGLFLAHDLNTPLGVTDFVPHTGYLNAINVVVPGHPVGDSSATFVLRVWPTDKSYATAMSCERAESSTFVSGPLGSNPPDLANPAPDLDTRGALGFQGFSTLAGGGISCPEPSTYAFAIAGLGAIALFRGRKQ